MLKPGRLRLRSTSRRHYAKPPITEALIDLHIDAGPDASLESLRPLRDALSPDFPEPRERVRGQVELNLSPAADASLKQTRSVDAYVLLSGDRTQALQLGLPAFTFSHLPPYTSWERLRDMAHKYWDLYVSALHPRVVTRAAVRYINRFDIPFPRIEFKDYFRTGLEISPDLPQVFSSYFFQVEIPSEALGAHAIVNQTIVPPPTPEATSVLFDIAVVDTENLPPDSVALWECLDRLHEVANDVFEASITDRMRGVIE